MNVSAPFIARPIATALLAIAILLGSILGYRLLPISSLPQVDFPTIQITTQLPGASADTVAALVTAPLERQLSQISGLQTLSSMSSYGWSQITLQFILDRNIDAASQDVQSAITAANSTLPSDLPYPPTYAKVNPADPPIVTLAITSDTVSLPQLSDIADTLIGQRLSQITGVGRVTVQGRLRPAVRVQIDLPRLASYGISLSTLRAAIANANLSGSKGSLDGAQQALSISANDQLESAKAYENVVIASPNGTPIFLKDVATVIGGLENNKVGGYYNGKPAIIIDVQRQPGANIVQTVELIQKQLPTLSQSMPASARLTIVSDRTGTIRASVQEVQLTLVLSVGLVILVVLLFLRTFSATIVAGVTLPLSIMASFGVMYFAGFSIDNLSLMALTIAAGFVVDDAIVMIENITRYIEEGLSPLEAAYKGAGEIGFTIISLTMSLIAVFIPLLFMTGIVGRLFREFALTLTITVIVSAVISLTLTPMMSARLLKAPRHNGHFFLVRWSEKGLDALLRFYRITLDSVLRHRRLTLVTAIVTLIATVALYVVIPKGFMPQQDSGLLTVTTEAAQDVSFERMQELQAQVEAVIRRDPDVSGVVSLVGIGAANPTLNAGRLAVSLKPLSQRANAKVIVARLQAQLNGIPGINSSFQVVQDIQIGTRTGRTPYQYVLVGADPQTFPTWAARINDALLNLPSITSVSSDLQNNGQRVQINVDRIAAGRLGVTMQAINEVLYDAFGQRQISTIYGQANQYRVVMEADPKYQTDPAALAQLYVAGTSGTQIPLLAVAEVKRVAAALVVNHVQQFPAVTFNFELSPGASLDEAIRDVKAAEASVNLPSNFVGSFAGDAQEFAQSLASQPWLIFAAVVVIYIVLGVLYESLVHPFTILTTLPSAGVGALLALMMFGMELSLIGIIGIILLMGIVKKNAILMIDFAIEAERTQGLSPEAAIREACLLRFRPIMMTTVAALLGALPLAVGHGAGAELRVPLGITIVGGLILSQILTLYTTPVIYLAMDGLRRRIVNHIGEFPGLEPDVETEPPEQRP
ncbi:efflux RND transporter permease subunit [Microvirga sp. 2MCAF38]|uniref:efflux RND transporter permease subunit n=1 Tax=Microvirga sp. 2MCAF38 TaxID=3232989 RepID=UPI003F9638F3